MARLKRYDIKRLLANPDLRRKLIVDATVATQLREGIKVTKEQVESSYYVVTEGERAAFFGLVSFRADVGENDGRHVEFVRALGDAPSGTRVDVALRDFASINGAPLAYDRLGLVGHLFREHPSLDPVFGIARQGKATGDDDRWLRAHWEVTSECWVPFSKGGTYSRFYSDIYLRIDWNPAHRTELKASGNGLPSEELYFRQGLTWPLRTQRGFNIRRLPSGCVFGHKGPAVIPKKEEQCQFLLGLLNSFLVEFMLRCLSTFGAWEVGAVKKIPVPTPSAADEESISKLAAKVHDLKAAWDTGNEICSRFDRPWVVQPKVSGGANSLSTALEAVLSREAVLDDELTVAYDWLNDAVYRLYGVNDAIRTKIETAIGERPPERVWPQMEGETADQKRMEHVHRLLTYLVRRIVEADADALVCLQPVAHTRPLIESVRVELAACFAQQDPTALETELVNELKRRVKGYRRTETLAEWLDASFFDTHAALYQQRPLLWHLGSSQESRPPAFSVIVHAHRFDREALAKLRSVHIRDRLSTLRREAAHAGQDGREDERLDLIAATEEVEAFDAKLKLLQEGAHAGPEGGEHDYRILTPWKKPSERLQGWQPDPDDGIKINIAPLARTGLLRTKAKFGERELED